MGTSRELGDAHECMSTSNLVAFLQQILKLVMWSEFEVEDRRQVEESSLLLSKTLACPFQGDVTQTDLLKASSRLRSTGLRLPDRDPKGVIRDQHSGRFQQMMV